MQNATITLRCYATAKLARPWHRAVVRAIFLWPKQTVLLEIPLQRPPVHGEPPGSIRYVEIRRSIHRADMGLSNQLRSFEMSVFGQLFEIVPQEQSH